MTGAVHLEEGVLDEVVGLRALRVSDRQIAAKRRRERRVEPLERLEAPALIHRHQAPELVDVHATDL